jgi:hypothetical protein
MSEDRERIAVLETRQVVLMEKIDETLARLDALDHKFDGLSEKFTRMTSFGDGAAWALVKVGAAGLGLLGGVVWLLDHAPKWMVK